LVVIGYLVYATLTDRQAAYFKPSEIVSAARAGRLAADSHVRVAGTIIPGSWTPPKTRSTEFEIIDTGRTSRSSSGKILLKNAAAADKIKIVLKNKPPVGFKKNLGVMVEGTYRSDGAVVTDKIYNWFFSMSTETGFKK